MGECERVGGQVNRLGGEDVLVLYVKVMVLSGNDGCRFVVVAIKNRFLFACVYVCRDVRVKVCVCEGVQQGM